MKKIFALVSLVFLGLMLVVTPAFAYHLSSNGFGTAQAREFPNADASSVFVYGGCELVTVPKVSGNGKLRAWWFYGFVDRDCQPVDAVLSVR